MPKKKIQPEKYCECCKKSYAKKSKQTHKQWIKSRFCNSLCMEIGIKEEQRIRMSKVGISNCGRVQKLEEIQSRMKSLPRNEGHYAWKGGITPLNQAIRSSFEYRQWRKSVFERDKYTCQECGRKSGQGKEVILNADHINPFAYFPELRFELSNGKTLCRECHRLTDTYGEKAKMKYEKHLKSNGYKVTKEF